MILELLKSLGKSLLFLIINSFIIIGLEANNMNLYEATFLGAAITILIYSYFNWNPLKEEFKRIKKDFKFKYVIISILTTISAIILHGIIIRLTGINSTNESELLNFFNTNKILFILCILVVSPLYEELTFRHTYRTVKNKNLALIVTTIIFVLFHLSTLKDFYFFIPYFIASIGIGITYFKTDNIYISYMAHVLNNFINVLLLFI